MLALPRTGAGPRARGSRLVRRALYQRPVDVLRLLEPPGGECQGVHPPQRHPLGNTGDPSAGTIATATSTPGKDRMVKRRGYRIELGEIERALYLHTHRRSRGGVDLRRGRREDRRLPRRARREEAVDGRLKTHCSAHACLHESRSFVFHDVAAHVHTRGGLSTPPTAQRLTIQCQLARRGRLARFRRSLAPRRVMCCARPCRCIRSRWT